MGCYVCGARSATTCHHCYEEICNEHAHFIESISSYLCNNCFRAYENGSLDVLSE